MSFRPVFLAVLIATGLIVGAFLLNSRRPSAETRQPTAQLVEASGKCAECHRNLQYSVVHEFDLSHHATHNVNCLDCHQPAQGQTGHDHHGFTIATVLTPGNCRSCHEAQYQQFARSRHAAPAWAAIYGAKDFRPEQVAASEAAQPGGVNRSQHPLVDLEGSAATGSGCGTCHAIGRPNADGTIGTCTACHARHASSVAVARLPTTCGQCHMGPDHSQLEIYSESKHGVMFEAQRDQLNLNAPPKTLTTRDMAVPTCATCHMSGLNGAGVTHEPSERLSYYLFAEITQKRPNFEQAQAHMKGICRNCHAETLVDGVYRNAEAVVAATNGKVQAVKDMVAGLRRDGLLGTKPFQTPLDFAYFDFWHYDGRTSKHGAFMGGADFVQWHGNYPMLKHAVEIKAMVDQLRAVHAAGK